jgi:hypothetical protein
MRVTNRLRLTLILVATTALWLPPMVGAQAPALKPGVERWPVKTSVLSEAITGKTVQLFDLLGPADATDVRKNDSRYQSDRIPGVQASVGNEGDLITTTGWLHRAGNA